MKRNAIPLSTADKSGMLSAVFIALMIVSNLMGIKITYIGSVHFSVALFAFPFTFLITDIITEVHGKDAALRLVRTAFITLIMVFLFLVLFVSLPFAERSIVRGEYTKVFTPTARILIASLVAYYCAQIHDVHAFSHWKKRTDGRHLWLRNNLSTIVSQFIDTILFYAIAFLHIPLLPDIINTPPTFTPAFVFTLLLPYYALKVLVALFDTPLVYIGVRWVRGSGKVDRVE